MSPKLTPSRIELQTLRAIHLKVQNVHHRISIQMSYINFMLLLDVLTKHMQ